MSPLTLGLIFIIVTVLIVLGITILYSATAGKPGGIAPTIISTPGQSCNPTDSTNPLCNATIGLQCINNVCLYGAGGPTGTGNTCTSNSQCSVYPTLNGTPVTGAVQMQCLNSDGSACNTSSCKCYAPLNAPCVGPSITIPAGSCVIQCAPPYGCNLVDPSDPTGASICSST
jgi:hypothetical protein